MNKEELYEKISKKRGKNVEIKRTLCFYNPKQVYEALASNAEIKEWLNFISNHYSPPKKKVLLIYPCSADKPYHKSRSYKALYETLSKLEKRREEVHLVTITEPFGLIPEEFYDAKESWYDCPGLFEWWCKKYGQPYSKEHLEKSIEHLADHVAKFLTKAKRRKSYSKIVAFVRTHTSKLKIREDHTHKRIIERAAEISSVHIDILPNKKIVSEIVEGSGKFAWDMYGVAHPKAQAYLLEYLRRVLNQKWYTKFLRPFFGSVN